VEQSLLDNRLLCQFTFLTEEHYLGVGGGQAVVFKNWPFPDGIITKAILNGVDLYSKQPFRQFINDTGS